jgi:Ca-activated chloride channel family protein
MDLLWPGFLVLLILIPLIIAAYIWIQRKRRKVVVRYSSLSLVREAKPQYSRIRRYLPFALFLSGLGGLIVALSRPVSIVAVPTDQTTIILALDVSRSMCSTDIPPHRLGAAQDAAIEFVTRQKQGTRIGVVAFSGFAEMVQPPTTNQEDLRGAIDSLVTGRRTAIGSAILKSIDVIAEIDENIPPSVDEGDAAVDLVPVPKGAFAPHIVVLLTDGASNAGMMPVDAAQQAADRGIRVYTIGFGTARGAEFAPCGAQLVGREPGAGGVTGGGFGGSFGGGFGGGGGRFRRGIDEETLKQVAAITDGEYYSAESADELVKTFQNLPTSLIAKHQVTEVSAIFVAMGGFLLILAIALSLLWHPLP